jgi:hypothetical protein
MTKTLTFPYFSKSNISRFASTHRTGAGNLMLALIFAGDIPSLSFCVMQEFGGLWNLENLELGHS